MTFSTMTIWRSIKGSKKDPKQIVMGINLLPTRSCLLSHLNQTPFPLLSRLPRSLVASSPRDDILMRCEIEAVSR